MPAHPLPAGRPPAPPARPSRTRRSRRRSWSPDRPGRARRSCSSCWGSTRAPDPGGHRGAPPRPPARHRRGGAPGHDQAEQELWADVQPEFAAIHELRSDLPVECITICAPSFAGNHWAMALTDQGAWAPDVAADLAFHRALLQAVQHGGRRWLSRPRLPADARRPAGGVPGRLRDPHPPRPRPDHAVDGEHHGHDPVAAHRRRRPRRALGPHRGDLRRRSPPWPAAGRTARCPASTATSGSQT